MRHTRRLAAVGAAAGTVVLATIVGSSVPLAQTAPLQLGPIPPAAIGPAVSAPAPRVAATTPAPVPPKPIAAPAQKPAKAKPVAKPASVSVPGAPPAAAKPAKLVTPAQKVPPAVRRAAAIAAKTAQPVPPQHAHVFKPYEGTCANPDALGVSRVLEVDTTDGLYLGQLYSGRLPLEPKEIVLTFDDGPLPHNTERVLAALDKECVKATYFIVGQMAKAHPETLRKIAAAGHTVGYHTMTHPLDMVKRPLDWAKGNISDGWRTVDTILYGHAEDRPATPFFRYPGLFNSASINQWLNGLNVGVFAADATGNDWVRGYDAQKVMDFAMKDIERGGSSGILLLHDTKDSTATMIPTMLRDLKARGYKIVHLVPKTKPPALSGTKVAGVIPERTPAPVGERTVAGFDTGRQLSEAAAGNTGRTSTEPLPAYDTGAMRQTLTETGRVPATGSGALVPASASIRTTESTAAAEDGWFASTAGTFRGLGSAMGLW